MSLLEKALDGNPQAVNRSGLFAKAARALQEERRRAEEDTGLEVSSTPDVIPRFELSVADIATVEAELLALPDSSDYFLAVFERISEAIPFEAVALFLPENGGFAAAACLGFPVAEADYIPVSLARGFEVPGSSPSPESAGILSTILGIPSSLVLHGAAMRDPKGAVLGLWVYASANLGSDKEAIAALGRLLAAPGHRGATVFQLTAPSPHPAAELLASARGESWATAFRLDLAPSYLEFDMRIPGVLSKAFRSVFLSAARRVLGRRGTAVLSPEGFLACLFFSSSPQDPDLALFQFRKSLRRVLPLFEGVEPPSGSAVCLDLSAETTQAELSRFLAG